MNKKANNTWAIVLIIVAIIILALFYFGGLGFKSLKDHGEPADISKDEDGQGMDVTFYKKVDGEWVPVNIPDWFKVVSEGTGVVGAIVEHPPAPTCATTSDCPGSGSNPDVTCWQGKCVLVDIDGMQVTIRVSNGADFDFNDVYISSATPTGFANALPTGTANKQQLPAGGEVSWASGIMDLAAEGWIGTQQTFSVIVQGTNSYDDSTQSSSDSITLKFSEDPTGSFSVIIEAGVPQ